MSVRRVLLDPGGTWLDPKRLDALGTTVGKLGARVTVRRWNSLANQVCVVRGFASAKELVLQRGNEYFVVPYTPTLTGNVQLVDQRRNLDAVGLYDRVSYEADGGWFAFGVVVRVGDRALSVRTPNILAPEARNVEPSPFWPRAPAPRLLERTLTLRDLDGGGGALRARSDAELDAIVAAYNTKPVFEFNMLAADKAACGASRAVARFNMLAAPAWSCSRWRRWPRLALPSGGAPPPPPPPRPPGCPASACARCCLFRF